VSLSDKSQSQSLGLVGSKLERRIRKDRSLAQKWENVVGSATFQRRKHLKAQTEVELGRAKFYIKHPCQAVADSRGSAAPACTRFASRTED